MRKKILVLTLLIVKSVSAKDIGYKDYDLCGLNKKSQKLAKLLIETKDQLRKQLSCNQELAKAAYLKAKLMAETNKVTHYIDNVSPNELLIRSGIELPYEYERIGNQVEAVSGGMRTSKKAYKHFLTSEVHKSHLMGEHEFYLEQNHIGVGHYKDSSKKHVDYWVVYITKLKGENERLQTVLEIKPDKLKLTKKAKKKKMTFRSLNTIVK